MPNSDKTLTGAAGAYFIAFRLSEMGYAVGLTAHGTRSVDLVVANPDTGKSITIQCKTATDAFVQSRKWGNYWKWRLGTGPKPIHKDFFYALIDLKGGHPETPDIFLVASTKLKEINYDEYKREGRVIDVWCGIDEDKALPYKDWNTIIENALR